jgi:hypothetical protein
MTTFPLALLFAAVFGEVQALAAFPYLYDFGFLIAFALVTSMGPLITYSSMLCVTVTSPLTGAITGNVKDLVVTVAGAVMFPGFAATASTVAGLSLSFLGAGAYTVLSIRSGGKGAATAATSSAVEGAKAPRVESEAEGNDGHALLQHSEGGGAAAAAAAEGGGAAAGSSSPEKSSARARVTAEPGASAAPSPPLPGRSLRPVAGRGGR